MPNEIATAARRLLRSPMFTTVAVVTLAIGIGATVDRLSARSDFLRQTLLREVSNFGMSVTAVAAE